VGRNYSPAARLEIERERWRREQGIEAPVSTSTTDRRTQVVIVPIQLELPFDEDSTGR
jgi:hypothetical protein